MPDSVLNVRQTWGVANTSSRMLRLLSLLQAHRYWAGADLADVPLVGPVFAEVADRYPGIDEPRLGAFAHAIAASGVAVLTPEIRELCDYRIVPASIETIGESARRCI